MQPFKETIINSDQAFPFDIFIQDNRNKTVQVEPHWHDCLEILFMLRGTAHQKINDNSYTLVAQDMIIIRQGDIHSTYCSPSDDSKILVVKFLPMLLDRTGLKTFESKYITSFLNLDNPKFQRVSETKEGSTLRGIFMGIFQEYIDKTEGYEIFIKGYIYQLIACLIRNNILKANELNINDEQFKQLEKLIDYIEKNYKYDLNLKDASKMMNFSYHYLSRFFKKTTGKNFKEYLDFVRVCEAEKLILANSFSISKIAQEVGFSDTTCFNRTFKRVRKYTPSDLKKTKTANI